MPTEVERHDGPIERMETGITGLDRVLGGGIPRGRSLLVAGETGTGKTVLLNEFLYRGITLFQEPGVFVSFEEPADDLRRNVIGFGWDYQALEAVGMLVILDFAPSLRNMGIELNQSYTLEPLIAIMATEIERVKAKRVAIDNLANLFRRYGSENAVRQLFFQLTARLKELGVTALISAERYGGRSSLSERGVEEFVAEGVLLLTQFPGELHTLRRMSILKLRGLDFQAGVVEYQISKRGFEAFPRIPLTKAMAPHLLTRRKSTGIAKLDALLHGGFPEGHIVLVSGNSGAGKTVLGLHFVNNGLEAGESVVVLTIEESCEQLVYEAGQFGWAFEQARAEGRLAFVDVPFSGMRADQILFRIVNVARQTGAKRLVMDSISALISAGASQREVRLFLEQLVSFCKTEGITAVLTYAISGAFGAAAGQLLGGTTITEARLSSLVDAIILLNYVERADRVDKLMSVLKLRGSDHDQGVFCFTITARGIEIRERVR